MARTTERRRAARPAAAGAPAKSPRVAKPATPGGAPTPGVAVAGFELDELRRLIRLVQRTGIGELELCSNGRSVRISATPAGGATWAAGAAAPPAARSAAPAPAPPQEAPPEPASRLKEVVSPMVGTFYRSPAPDADPFVEVGDVVEVGQTVCIIEAMKLMNEIEAETKGRIVQVLVENAQPVEFGQKLFLVEPI